jgi:hypothetical protein
MLAKITIALVAFPLFAHILFTLTRLGLRLLGPALSPLMETASDVFRHGSLGVAVLVGLVGSFKICRRLWPSPAIEKS